MSGIDEATGLYKLTVISNSTDTLTQANFATITFKVLETVTEGEELLVKLSEIEIGDSNDEWTTIEDRQITLKLEKEREFILEENKKINENLKTLENNYSIKLKQEIKKVENKYEDEIYNLKKENRFLNKVINTFEKTVNKFIKWIVKKFDVAEEDNLIRNFEKETQTFIDPEKQIKKEEIEKEWDLQK